MYILFYTNRAYDVLNNLNKCKTTQFFIYSSNHEIFFDLKKSVNQDEFENKRSVWLQSNSKFRESRQKMNFQQYLTTIIISLTFFSHSQQASLFYSLGLNFKEEI